MSNKPQNQGSSNPAQKANDAAKGAAKGAEQEKDTDTDKAKSGK